MIEQLRVELMKRLPSRRPAERAAELTVGVEQEFFLLWGPSPASHEDSQRFFAELSSLPGWSVSCEHPSDSGAFVWGVASSGGQVKYDHHPHLLEIATLPCENLHELRGRLGEAWDTVTRTAERTGTVALSVPLLSLLGDDQRLTSPLSRFRALRHYRGLLFRRRGQLPDAALVNYAAVIAATQTHVGGLPWVENDHLVDSLYRLEPALLALIAGTALGESALWQVSALVRERWRGYLSVFEGFPLAGFPPGQQWSLDGWFNHLTESPLAGGEDDAWAGKTLGEIGEPPDGNWDTFFTAVRDLQSVRPRLFGTIEFRADPAQPTLEAVAGVAALRLGLCSAVLEGAHIPAPAYDDARRDWLGAVNDGIVPNCPEILGLAEAGLRTRGLGEECYLDSFSRFSTGG